MSRSNDIILIEFITGVKCKRRTVINQYYSKAKPIVTAVYGIMPLHDLFLQFFENEILDF